MAQIRYAHIVAVNKSYLVGGSLTNNVVVYSQYPTGHGSALADCEAIAVGQIQSLLSVAVELDAKRVTNFSVTYVSGG